MERDDAQLLLAAVDYARADYEKMTQAYEEAKAKTGEGMSMSEQFAFLIGIPGATDAASGFIKTTVIEAMETEQVFAAMMEMDALSSIVGPALVQVVASALATGYTLAAGMERARADARRGAARGTKPRSNDTTDRPTGRPSRTRGQRGR